MEDTLVDDVSRGAGLVVEGKQRNSVEASQPQQIFPQDTSYRREAKEREAGERSNSLFFTRGLRQGSRLKYLQLASGLWTILSGPWSGLQVAAASEEGHLLVGTLSFSLSLQQVNAVCTTIFFLASFLFTVKPESRLLSRCWVFLGFCWLLCGWLTLMAKTFADKPELWLNICLIQTIFFAVTGFFPVLLTDPCVHAI